MGRLRAAAWSVPAIADPHRAVDALQARLEEAAARDVHLLVAPELVLGGRPAQPVDLDSPPEWWRNVCGHVRDTGVWLATSILRRQGPTLRNTFVLLGADGDVVGRQDKIHLWDREAQRVEAGREVTVFDTPWGRMGGLVCYDVQFPELARRMAIAGARVFLVSAAHYSGHGWDLSTRGRAFENGCHLVAANRVGGDDQGAYEGRSRIVDPFGHVAAEAPPREESVVVADVDAAAVERARAYAPFLRDLQSTASLERAATR